MNELSPFQSAPATLLVLWLDSTCVTHRQVSVPVNWTWSGGAVTPVPVDSMDCLRPIHLDVQVCTS